MTLGEAAGKLTQLYFDNEDFKNPSERREVLSSIPPECRFVDRDGKVAIMATLQAIFDNKEYNEAENENESERLRGVRNK